MYCVLFSNKLVSILCIESEYAKHHIRTDLNRSEVFKQGELMLNY